MKTIQILINSTDRIKEFVSDTSKINADLDLVSDRYVINAKSIMGIFSLDLAKPVRLDIYAEKEELDEIMKRLRKYMVK
ncbi:HPr family phosphocarrier protein [Anaerocolumna sp. AGMB13025]|uniref:HPr family phosphocarrier protein n=1 Tax=Anaerocolumna sp. AGMB13025 TaxID=3039116 RepID=UPI00241CADE6|nr:HPr family phosphocarrier protein [Anaerocolumna sp. AGMB13025]WFR54899.1 HPr family phosphocarrier protein [Anaerocolumna sp. AGMB13025]